MPTEEQPSLAVCMNSPQEKPMGADRPDPQLVLPRAFSATQPWPKPMLQKASRGELRPRLNGDGDVVALFACISQWGSRGGAAA